MRTLTLFASVLAAVCTVSAVPSFDPFADASSSGGTSYGVGNNLVGQNNSSLFGAWYMRGDNNVGTQPVIVAGNLSYPNMPPSSGNSISITASVGKSACLDLNLPALHTETAYYSFLVKITDLSTVSSSPTENPIAIFVDDPSTTITGNTIARRGTRLLTKKITDTTYVFGTGKSSSTSDFVYEPDGAAHSVGDVVFVVGSFQRAGGATNVHLWVNPSASSFGASTPPTPTLVAPVAAVTSGGLNNNNARAFAITCQFSGAPSGIIDDVRLATSWEFVTGGDPAITQNPANVVLPEGATASFTAAGRGTPELTYQWVKDGATALADGGNISGANSTALTISNVSGADAGSYSLIVSNGLGNFVTSANASLTLADPAIVANPESRTNNFGTTAEFTVGVSGTAPFTYQWVKDGVGDLSDSGNISGSQTATLTLSGVSFPDGGNYYVRVNNTAGTSDSAVATLTVRDPYIITQPQPAADLAGETVTFTVVADGTGPFNYQWRRNGNLIFDLGKYSGTSTATLTVSDIAAEEEGAYSVLVIGAYDTATSDNASLTVVSPVAISAQPVSRTVTAGSKAIFSVGVTGTPPFTYQWLFDGDAISGATDFAHIISNAQVSDEGDYSVIVGGQVNAVTSSVAALTIAADLPLASTNLVVIRVGDGAQTLTLTGNSIFLDQFTTSGSYVNSISIPDQGPSAMLTFGWNHINQTSGTVTGSGLTRSLDGRYMVIAGYNIAYPFGVNLNGTTAASVPRAVGFINSQGQYTMPFASQTAYNSTFWRSAVSDGTNNYWGAAGASGTLYFGLDDSAATVQTQFANVRGMGLFNGNIYLAGAVAGNNGILKLDGMPRTAVTPTHLFSGSTGTTEMDVSPDGNLIYIADDRALINNGGIQRWEFDGSTWNLAYTLTGGLGDAGPRYVTADFSGPNPVVYAVTKAVDNNLIVRIVDTGAGSEGATVASAGANQVFRGIRFGPVAGTVVDPPTIFISQNGNTVTLSWEGSFTLQSSTNVAGPYSPVLDASSPHNVDSNLASQTFFRLAQ